MTIDTIETARQAGFVLEGDLSGAGRLPMLLEHFAALVRAQVIEEAVQLCEHLSTRAGTADKCADALRGMKSDSGHSSRAGAEASKAQPTEPIWCDCGDGITPNTGAKCWICAANDATEIEELRAENAELQRALTMSGKLTRKLVEEATASYRQQTDLQYRAEVGRSIEATLKAAASMCDLAPHCPCFDKQGQQLAPCWFAAHATPKEA